MGNTTIIELNHDKVEEIFQDEETQKIFLNQIYQQLATFEHSRQKIQGGKVLAGFHRSGTIYNKWIKFKKKMNW